jgi:hypothetical protein
MKTTKQLEDELMDERFYLQYEDGTLSSSGSLKSTVKALMLYRTLNPDKQVRMLDNEQAIVPLSIISVFARSILNPF